MPWEENQRPRQSRLFAIIKCFGFCGSYLRRPDALLRCKKYIILMEPIVDGFRQAIGLCRSVFGEQVITGLYHRDA
jgi:hypothetical protein